MAIAKPNIATSGIETLSDLWINRALEALWLLTVLSVPLAFLDRDFIRSEAVIGYVEVPKIALLRTLVALMAILWLVEWGIRGRASGGLFGEQGLRQLLSTPVTRIGDWFKARPSRWLFLAVWFFLGSTLLTTVLSGSRSISLWGEVPGQDSYPAYTVVAYVLLFAVVATHLKTKAQLWRLFGAIVVMGVAITGYGILQHYGHDFLNLTEQTGGKQAKISSFMGNGIFAAAVMLMTIVISTAAAALTVRDPSSTDGNLHNRMKMWAINVSMTSGWGVLLAVQLLGITFTFARGPWIGTLFGVAVFLGLVLIFLGRNYFMRALLPLGLAVGFILTVLLWQGSFSSVSFGPLLGVVASIVGIAWVSLVLAPWPIIRRVSLGLGLSLALGLALMLAVISFSGSGSPTGGPERPDDLTATEVIERFGSVKQQVLTGFGGRGTHWKVSWELIRDRPWFDFDDLSLSWLRPLIGYGPDLFRNTYLLRSPAEGEAFLPLEPDHAHNYFIHQTVEQGLLGLLSSLGIFAAVLAVGGYQLVRLRHQLSPVHKVVLIVLLAALAGKALEMIVGVAKVSDLTILWVLLAIFAALPMVMREPDSDAEEALTAQKPTESRRRRIPRGPPARASIKWNTFWRMAIVAWLVGGIAVFTWVKGINYVRAGVEEANAVKLFTQGNWQGALESLDKAIDLAPDVSSYHNDRAQVFVGYMINDQVTPERACTNQKEIPYRTCLAKESLDSNIIGVQQRPYAWRPHLALANSAHNLRFDDLAAQFYLESATLVPASWFMHNELADSYIQSDRYTDALPIIERSLAITDESILSIKALFLQGKAYSGLGDLEATVASLERALALGIGGSDELEAREILAGAYSSLSRTDLAAELLKRLGDTYAAKGNIEEATNFIERAIDEYETLGRTDLVAELLLSLATDYQELGENQQATSLFERTVEAYERLNRTDLAAGLLLSIADGQLELGNNQEAANFLERSTESFDKVGDLQSKAHALYFLGLAYAALGDLQKSLDSLNQSFALDPGNTLRRQVLIQLAELYGNAVQRELQRAAGTPKVKIGQSKDALETVAGYLHDNPKVYLNFDRPDLAPRFLYQLGLAFLSDGLVDSTMGLFQRSARLFLSLDQQEEAALAFAQEISAYQFLTQEFRWYSYGRLLAESALLYDKFDNPSDAAMLHLQMGRAFMEKESPGSAAKYFEKSAELYESLDEPTLLAETLDQLGLAYQEFGESEKSAQAFERSSRLREDMVGQ